MTRTMTAPFDGHTEGRAPDARALLAFAARVVGVAEISDAENAHQDLKELAKQGRAAITEAIGGLVFSCEACEGRGGRVEEGDTEGGERTEAYIGWATCDACCGGCLQLCDMECGEVAKTQRAGFYLCTGCAKEAAA